MRQHKADAADGDQDLQIAVVAIGDRLHPAVRRIIVQGRQAAGVAKVPKPAPSQAWSCI